LNPLGKVLFYPCQTNFIYPPDVPQENIGIYNGESAEPDEAGQFQTGIFEIFVSGRNHLIKTGYFLDELGRYYGDSQSS